MYVKKWLCYPIIHEWTKNKSNESPEETYNVEYKRQLDLTEKKQHKTFYSAFTVVKTSSCDEYFHCEHTPRALWENFQRHTSEFLPQ